MKHTDLGDHHFSYALSPHTGSWKQGESTRRAREFNNPLLVQSQSEAPAVKPLLAIGKSNIFIDSVKKAEDSADIIVRVHEGHGDSTDVNIQLGFKPKNASECDLLEQVVKPLKISKDRVQLRFKPFEIKTVRFELKAAKGR